MEYKDIRMHKQTCLVCGYEGYQEDTEVIKRGVCPKCGAEKLATYPEGEEPKEVIAIRDALNQAREEQSLQSGKMRIRCNTPGCVTKSGMHPMVNPGTNKQVYRCVNCSCEILIFEESL